MEPFKVVHRFRTLSRRGFVTPLVCSLCSHDLTIRVGTNDEPVSQCFTCGAVANISMATILYMERVITNYENGLSHGTS